jgi:hypothetical protein
VYCQLSWAGVLHEQKFYCKSAIYEGAIKNTSPLFWK